jgi:hypothetical protein
MMRMMRRNNPPAQAGRSGTPCQGGSGAFIRRAIAACLLLPVPLLGG